MSTEIKFSDVRPDYVDLQSSHYRHSSGESIFIRSEGLAVIPVMGDEDTPPVIVRVHAPVAYRHGKYKATKHGSPPLFPAQQDTNSGDIILMSNLTFPTPVEDSQSRLVFGVECDYTYVQIPARGANSLYPINSHAFATLIDGLGEFVPNQDPTDKSQGSFGTWNTDVVDSRFLQTYGIFV